MSYSGRAAIQTQSLRVNPMRQINIEGYSPDEILSLPDEQLDALAFSGEPFVFRVD